MSLNKAIFLMGPTASGKTALAVHLYQHFPVDLISVDSALVYQDMCIGVAKPDEATLKLAPHALIDLIPPTQVYSAASFKQDAEKLIQASLANQRIPLLVGGTMLYFNALQHGLSNLPEADPSVRLELDEEALRLGWPAMHQKLLAVDPPTAQKIQINDAQRIQRALEVYRITGIPLSQFHQQKSAETFPYSLLKIALIPSDRALLHARIKQRFLEMLEDGLVDEVKNLVNKYPSLTPEHPAMRSVGYRQVLAYLNHEYSYEELKERGVYATRQLAKRQLTWLRKMNDVRMIDPLNPGYLEEASSMVKQFIESQ
jgi:tRNA dimethylallyltransferase